MQGKVLEFWRAVEMFSPPAIPEVGPGSLVFDVASDKPLPWSPGHPLRRQRLTKDQTWRHIVYFGTYRIEKVYPALKSVFPAVGESFEERPSGESALVAFAVSDKGTMLEGSIVLSACAWAMTRTIDPGPAAADWLDGFAEHEAQFATRLEEAYRYFDLLGKRLSHGPPRSES